MRRNISLPRPLNRQRTAQRVLKAAIVTTAILSGPIYAQNWDANAADGLWTSPTNWSTDALPGTTATVAFNAQTNQQTIQLGVSPITIQTLNFTANTSSKYLLQNGALTLNSVNQTADDANELAPNVTISTKNSGVDVLTSNVTTNILGLQGQITSGGITKTGNGTLRLGTSDTSFNNAINGNVVINGGTFQAAAANVAGQNNPLGGTGNITIGAGGVTLSLTHGNTTGAANVYDFGRDIVANNNSFTLNVNRAAGTQTGKISQAGTLSIGNATLTVTGDNGFQGQLDGVNIASGATTTISVNSNGNNAGGNHLRIDALNGDNTTTLQKTGGQTLFISPTATFAGKFVLGGGTTQIESTALGGNALTGAQSVTFTNGSTLNLRADVDSSFIVPIKFAPGVLNSTINADRLTTSGAGSKIMTLGDVNASGATLTLSSSNTNGITASSFTVDAGATAGLVVNTNQNGTLTSGLSTVNVLNLPATSTLNVTGSGVLALIADQSTTANGTINLRAGNILASAAGSLGTGAITVGNTTPTSTGFLNDFSRLIWKAQGASAKATGPKAVAIAGGAIDLDVTPAATDVFDIQANARIQGNAAQLQALTVGTNITLAPNAIIAHEQPGAATATITGLANNANLYYGLAGNATSVPTIGAGTPWKGISTDNGDRGIQGVDGVTPAIININGADNNPDTIEATLQTMADKKLDLGLTNGYTWASTAGAGQKVTLAIRGELGISTLGQVSGGRVLFNKDAASTGLAAAVDKIIVQSGSLSLSTNNALGTVPVEVQNNGSLDIGSTAGAAMSGDVNIKSGGVLYLNDNVLLTGTGAITIESGGKLDITGSAPANILTLSGTNTQAINFTGSGHTVRFAASNIGNLDSKVPDSGATFVVAGGTNQNNFGNSNLSNLPINQQTAGLTTDGGLITNDNTSRGLDAPITIGSNGATFAANRNTNFVLNGNVNTSGNVQVGSVTAIDGRDKTGNFTAVNPLGFANPYDQTAQVIFGGDFIVGGNVTVAPGTSMAITTAASRIAGDLNFNGNVLYLDSGGNVGGTTGQLTPRLLTTDTATTPRVANKIILGNYGRIEMGINDATGRQVVTQPFVITGDVNPQDKRTFFIARVGGSATLGVDLADVTLNEGSVFGVQTSSTDVRASLKLAGNVTTINGNGNTNWHYGSVVRDASLPEFNGTNPVVITQGRVNVNGTQGENTLNSNVYGTIAEGVQIDLIRAQIRFQGAYKDNAGNFQPGAVINGVIRAQTAAVGGDAFVVSTSGDTSNPNPTSVGGTGRIEIGRSAAANGPEDFEIQGTEVASGTSPLHTHTGEVRVVNDNDNTSIDGIVRSNRSNDNTQPARVQADKIVLESGATVQLAASNAIPLIVSAIDLQGNGTINTAATGMTINAVNAGTNHVTFTGTQSPTINGPITAGEVTVTSIALNFPATLNSKLNVGGNNAAATVNGSVANGLNVSGGNSTATIKGDVTGGLNVTTGTATFDGTGAPAGTRTVTGPVSLDAGAIAVTNGTLDLGSTVITSTPTQTLAGLREAKVSGAFNLTSANTSNDVKLGPVQAQLTTGWGTNETYIYSGQFFVPDNNGNGTGSFAFAENFDDSVRVMIDGTQRLSNGTHNDATGTGALTLPAGWHDVEFRFGQGTGGAGPFASEGWTGTLGFGLDLDSTDFDPAGTNPVQAKYVAPVDSGSMNLFRTTVSSSLTVGAGSTLKAGGLTNVGKISLTGANAKVTLDSASGPAVQSSADSVEVSAGASGNIEIVRAGDKLTVGGMSAQGAITVNGGGDLTINGNVTGSAAFVHAGTGILTVNGQMDAPTTVSSGGTVGGNATFNGGLAVTNGTLAPGLSPGLMTASTLTTGINATFQLEVGGTQPGVTYDQIVITGNTVDISGSTLSLSVTSAMHPNDVLTLILNNGTDANVGAFAGIANGSFISLSGGYEVQISYFDDASVPGLQLAGGNDVSIVVTVPEPSAAVALLGGIATLISLSRFRRRNS